MAKKPVGSTDCFDSRNSVCEDRFVTGGRRRGMIGIVHKRRRVCAWRRNLEYWGKEQTMTFKASLAMAAFGGLFLTSLPHVAQAHHHTRVVEQVTIVVSCYRGPWEDVIWDRPNPVFTDSLVAAGYTFPEAHAIAERVCRDPSTVGSNDGLHAVMTRILASTPPSN
jgi:hypothetical protein